MSSSKPYLGRPPRLRRTLGALVAGAAFAAGAPAKADAIDIFKATGYFQGGLGLGGSVLIDEQTGYITSAAFVVSGQPVFYYLDNTINITPSYSDYIFTSPSTEVVPGLQLPSLSLILPSSFVGYRGGEIAPQIIGTTPGLNLPETFQSGLTSLTGPGSEPLLTGSLSKPSGLGQTVYLDFSANSAAVFNLTSVEGAVVNNTHGVYDKPAATIAGKALNAADEDTVLSSLRSIYSAYNVNFTVARPTSGNYDTVYVGGTTSLVNGFLPAALGNGTAGVAQDINVMDSVKDQTVAIFTDQLIPGAKRPTFFFQTDNQLAQVIGHEVGHILGLQHVTGSDQLLYPIVPGASDFLNENIGGREPVGVVGPHSSVVAFGHGWTQDSNADLLCAVGNSSGITDCSSADSNTFFKLQTGSLGIFDTKLVLVNAADDADTGATILDLGTLTASKATTFVFPAFAGEQVVLEGASSEGGPIDIFAGLSTKNYSGALSPTAFETTLEDGSGKLALNNLTFYEEQKDGTFSAVGSGSLSGTVPEPDAWLLMVVGVGLAGCFIRRRRGFGFILAV